MSNKLTCEDVGCRCVEDPVKLANENARLRKELRLVLAFHSADIMSFVRQHGAGMTTHEMCDRIRAALAAEGEE